MKVGSNMNILKSVFIGNQAYRGGVIYVSSNSMAYVHNCKFTRNSAQIQGSVFFVDASNANLSVISSTISENNCVVPECKFFKLIFEL